MKHAYATPRRRRRVYGSAKTGGDWVAEETHPALNKRKRSPATAAMAERDLP